ncbi:hypothetical protein H2201_001306 [Coniosporium apollinis]|uniref:AB hydrolase-1 domain-containing protein n=2 Tax=Coniosporium TaxID=2810619 RepID=A0ABQ9P238_9PEZI|nr:hypothetical protein H2199_001716 [Cladosporium sp. JES 115]KAJ9668664.1 hypothetical protein H2201_001306 [Coniosporium apollinis]
MSTSLFRVHEHVLPCQHIRQYPRATAGEQEDVLHLSIKQYTPLSNPNPRPGDVTIIGGHANGFPKVSTPGPYVSVDLNLILDCVQELYEPLWDELLKRTEKSSFRIRGIWIADVAHQGASGVLNEGKLGNDPSWYDHPRDLLHMVNHFRSQMPRPLIGIGHSMGGNNLVNLSLMHPRLLETLVLIDPVIQRFSNVMGNHLPAQASAFRRDLWPSRAAAAASYKKSAFYRAWDPRVLDLWLKHGLRDLPTELYPSTTNLPTSSVPVTAEPTVTPEPPEEKQVTLTTTKHQEVFTFLRPKPSLDPSTTSATSSSYNRLTHPDVTPLENPQAPFYRPEPIITFHNLPFLRPSVLYIFGTESPMSAPEFRAEKMATTGTGVSGSGGAAEGRVKEVVMEGVGHLIPMERVKETAEACKEWIGAEMGRWREQEEKERKEWRDLPKEEKIRLSEKNLELLGGLEGLERRAVRKEKL